MVSTFSSIISVCLEDLCFVCGQLAWNMIKSGRKNETPWGGVTKDSLTQLLPFLMSRSLPPRSSLHSHPPASSLPLPFSSVLSSLLCEPSGHRSVHSASKREGGGGWVLWEIEVHLDEDGWKNCRDELTEGKQRLHSSVFIQTGSCLSVHLWLYSRSNFLIWSN